MPEVSEEENTAGVDSEQEFLVTIQLVGYGKADQVGREIRETLKRVLPLEFGPMVKACRVTPAATIRLD